MVHAHELKAVVNCLVASKLSGTKVRISHTHTPISEWQIPALKKVLNIKINSFTVNLFSSKEIALTESRKKIKVSEGIKQNKLEVIPNGLDISKFDLSQEEIDECRGDIRQRYGIGLNDYVVGVIGRLTVEKGADILVKAFAKLLQNVHLDKQTTKLLIVGGGNKEEEIKRLVGDLGIEQNVVITGRFEEKDKVAFYYSLDCFAFPSLAEGFGIVLIEAMASKLAIVASDLPVLQEVAGSTAVFFERKNASDLADKLFNVYTKRNRLESVKLEARNRVEKLFSMQRFVDSYENLYKNLLENKS